MNAMASTVGPDTRRAVWCWPWLAVCLLAAGCDSGGGGSSGPSDAMRADGQMDASPVDAAPPDVVSPDAAPLDAAPPDAARDAAPPDAGPDAQSADMQPADVGADMQPTDAAADMQPVDAMPDATAAVCGNGTREGTEECDDGNQRDGDGCSAVCTREPVCGDGMREGLEECDDGNTDPGDGCSPVCQREPVCGDGVTEGQETCDDGNTDDGDGCSAVCQIEPSGPRLAAARVVGAAGGPVQVQIELVDVVAPVSTAQFTVRFDPAFVQPAGAPALGVDAQAAGKMANGNVVGARWIVLLAGFNNAAIGDADGDGRRALLALPFTIAAGAAGASTLDVTDVVLSDPAGAPVMAAAEDGAVVVQ